MALTVQNTFIHGVENDSNFNVAEECDGPQPCLGRAHTEPAPTSATTDEHPCERERHCTSDDAPPPSAAVTHQEEDISQPAVCRIETRDDEGRYEWQPRCKQPQCHSNDAPPLSAAATQLEEDVALPALCRFETIEDEGRYEWQPRCKQPRCTYNDAPPPSAAATQQEEGVSLPALCRFETRENEGVCGRAIDADASLRIVVSGLMKGNVSLEDDLRCFFYDAGCKVADVRLVLDRKKKGKNRGFSFVDLEDHESLDLALKLRNTGAEGLAEKDGKLRIEKARERRVHDATEDQELRLMNTLQA